MRAQLSIRYHRSLSSILGVWKCPWCDYIASTVSEAMGLLTLQREEVSSSWLRIRHSRNILACRLWAHYIVATLICSSSVSSLNMVKATVSCATLKIIPGTPCRHQQTMIRHSLHQHAADASTSSSNSPSTALQLLIFSISTFRL